VRAGMLAAGDGTVEGRGRLSGLCRAVLLLAVVLLPVGCRIDSESDSEDALVALRTATLPPEHADGEELFITHCSVCHGRLALGTSRGPPLVHPIYAPGHHADAAFHLAVQQGVRAHHFRFGNMPPVPGLSRAEIDAVVAYVRWLQRTAGIE
jgi:cytochrome c